MANAIRNIFMLAGTRFPRSDAIPNENAISVAVGIPQPCTKEDPWFKGQFVWQKDEALFGLGSHQEDHMNLRGTMQYLYQHNLKKSVPVLLSSKGYGLLFDAGSTMIFHDDSLGSFMQMNAVNELDYYFMYGPEFDQVVGHYRTLTGKVQIMPKYIFGYVQSKERYKTLRI